MLFPGHVTVVIWCQSDLSVIYTLPGCWYPSGKFIADGLGLPPCKTSEEEAFAREAAYYHVVEQLQNRVTHS